MALHIRTGDRRSVNREVLIAATQQTPSLVIDCANAADPHALLAHTTAETLDAVYVVEVDLLYKFRDALLTLTQTARSVDAKRVVVTTFDRLFHYQDEKENNDVYKQLWLLLRRCSATTDIIVAVRAGTPQGLYARYCGVNDGTHRQEPATGR